MLMLHCHTVEIVYLIKILIMFAHRDDHLDKQGPRCSYMNVNV